MSEFKGVLLNSTLAFFRKQFGKQAVDAAINSLSPGDRKLWPEAILDSNWYSNSAWGPVRRISKAMVEKPIPDMAVDMGKFNAEYVFSGVYKSLLIKDPLKMVEKFSWMHNFFYRGGLMLKTEFPTPSSAYLRYEHPPEDKPARSTCASTMGFWIRTIELAGGTRVTARHTACRAEGQEACEYSIVWK